MPSRIGLAQCRWVVISAMIALAGPGACGPKCLFSITSDRGASAEGEFCRHTSELMLPELTELGALNLLQTRMSISGKLRDSRNRPQATSLEYEAAADNAIISSLPHRDAAQTAPLGSKVTVADTFATDAGASVAGASKPSITQYLSSLVRMLSDLTKKPKRAKNRKIKAHGDHIDFTKRSKIHGGTKGEERWVMVTVGVFCLGLFSCTSCFLSMKDTPKYSQLTQSLGLTALAPEDVSEDEDKVHPTHEKVDEDTTGLLIFSIIEDGRVIAGGHGPRLLRCSRIVQAFTLLAFTMGIQITILFFVKRYCGAKAVYEIRTIYDAYELAMVGGNESYTTKTMYGENRAMPEHFDIDRFDSIPEHVKAKVCDIPLSQPWFFMIVLFLWTMTCVLDFRRCLDYFLALIIATPTIPTMKDAVVRSGPPMEETKSVVGVTLAFKMVIFWIALVPRLFMAVFMLWLGCRWLAATIDFADLILNACALEFFLCLRVLFYSALVPEHSKIDVQNTEIHIPVTRYRASLFSYLSATGWGVISVLWIIVYMFQLQTVLREYRWDVAEPCSGWLAERFGW
eukprot:gnl/TRDRNA2_/TRDRNA2_192158_c0_seq1.p1 gnl/TRDRNA2_/TRDRNA2_192158_c0~~gnl/TRDRNA2_/TRDRNA2_192158_c0_seq1.p1  ORF type:complete len:569 (+),score=61.06 gnl/TRDRNA2_/TRDRNA2_192158_c0_seq1:84-1790(+)